MINKEQVEYPDLIGLPSWRHATKLNRAASATTNASPYVVAKKGHDTVTPQGVIIEEIKNVAAPRQVKALVIIILRTGPCSIDDDCAREDVPARAAIFQWSRWDHSSPHGFCISRVILEPVDIGIVRLGNVEPDADEVGQGRMSAAVCPKVKFRVAIGKDKGAGAVVKGAGIVDYFILRRLNGIVSAHIDH